MNFTLSTSYSHSDPLLSRQGAAFDHIESLPSHNLVIWTNGSAPFLFGKDGCDILINCSFCGAETTHSYSAELMCLSFLLKPAPFCKVFASPGSTIKSATSFLFSNSRSVLSSFFPSFLHSQANMAEPINFLFFIFSQATKSCRHISFD